MVTEITDASFETEVLKSEIPMPRVFQRCKQVDATRRLVCCLEVRLNRDME